MTDNQTKLTKASATEFVAGIKDERRRKDCQTVMALMTKVTKSPPSMWGSSIVGFGSYHYKYASGREGDWCLMGFSPRKEALTLYILPGLHLQKDNLKKLGKVTTGKSCIYVKNLDDVHLPTLEKMARQALRDMKKHLAEAKSSAQKRKSA